MKDLSVIIPSYNTKDITCECIRSILTSLPSDTSVSYEIIVVDNASQDGSPEAIAQLPVTLLALKENIGYSKANNRGLDHATGRYILYLNSDVLTKDVNFASLIQYLDTHEDIGALTVKVNLPNGNIDPASHRGFPTIWRSFCYYAGLEKMFGKIPVLNSLIGGYHLTHENLNTIHEIDSPTGAFFLTRKSLVDRLGGFDESFFMYGEDIDLAFRIKELGYKIIYYPVYNVTHLKYQSGIKTKKETVRSKTKQYFYDAMKIFYKKHYAAKNPSFINTLIYWVIDLKYSHS
jgi:GT2 family glycosyltransferase